MCMYENLCGMLNTLQNVTIIFYPSPSQQFHYAICSVDTIQIVATYMYICTECHANEQCSVDLLDVISEAV